MIVTAMSPTIDLNTKKSCEGVYGVSTVGTLLQPVHTAAEQRVTFLQETVKASVCLIDKLLTSDIFTNIASVFFLHVLQTG